LWARFERVGQRVDLHEAVQVRAAAVQATPTGHPHREIHLSNLDLALQALDEDGPPDYEPVIMYVRPHWFGPAMRALRMPVLLVLMVVVVFFVPGWPDGKAILYHEKAILYVIIGVAAALLVKYSVLPWLQWVTTRYVVTTERLFVRKGIVLRRVVIDMPLSRIDEVESSSFIIDLFGSGTLIVSSRDGRHRLELPNMPNVTDVMDRLYRLAHRTRR
jgi:membrane protein YdbS with pleckstrin-like domain